VSPIKVGDAILMALAAFVFLLACSGCALISKTSTEADKLNDIRSLSFAAASIGTEEAIRENPSWYQRFEDAERNLNVLVETKAITGTLLRGVIDSLPVKELKSERARIAIAGATTLFDATAGSSVNLEKSPYLLAAATGIRDGMKVALRL